MTAKSGTVGAEGTMAGGGCCSTAGRMDLLAMYIVTTPQ